MNCGCLAKISFFDSVSYGEICNKTQLIPPVCLLDFFVCLNLNRFTKQGNYNVSLLRLFSLVINISLFVAFNSPFFVSESNKLSSICIVLSGSFDSIPWNVTKNHAIPEFTMIKFYKQPVFSPISEQMAEKTLNQTYILNYWTIANKYVNCTDNGRIVINWGWWYPDLDVSRIDATDWFNVMYDNINVMLIFCSVMVFVIQSVWETEIIHTNKLLDGRKTFTYSYIHAHTQPVIQRWYRTSSYAERKATQQRETKWKRLLIVTRRRVSKRGWLCCSCILQPQAKIEWYEIYTSEDEHNKTTEEKKYEQEQTKTFNNMYTNIQTNRKKNFIKQNVCCSHDMDALWTDLLRYNYARA